MPSYPRYPDNTVTYSFWRGLLAIRLTLIYALLTGTFAGFPIAFARGAETVSPTSDVEAEGGSSPDALDAHVQALLRAPHRLSGTPEYHAAADYVLEQLEAMNIETVIEQIFPSVQTQVARAEIQLGSGSTLPLVPMRPLGQITPVTPPEGLSGRLVYAGDGELESFGEQEARDALVVLDYNSGLGWLRAIRLGAQAVIVAGGSENDGSKRAWNQFFTTARVNIPRFYYNGPAEDLLAADEATVYSKITWQTTRGRNIIALIPGSNPIFYLDQSEVMLFAANLDSYGAAPRQSPAARSAYNVAGLLHLAEELKHNPPRRDTLLVFLDNQARGHQGSGAFYQIFTRASRDAQIETRRDTFENEKRYLTLLHELLREEHPMEVESEVHKELFNLVRGKTDDLTANLTYRQTVRRLAISREKKRENTDPSVIAELETQIEELQEEKRVWNELRRALGGNQDFDPVRPALEEVLELVREDIAGYLESNELQQQMIESDEALYSLFDDRFINFHASLMFGDASPNWGVVIGGDSTMHSKEDQAGLYGRLLAGLNQAYDDLREELGEDAADYHFTPHTVDGSVNPSRAFWAPPGLVHSGEIAGTAGIYNFVFATAQDKLRLEGTPDDLPENLNVANLKSQIRELPDLVRAAGNTDRLSLHRVIKPIARYQASRFKDNFRSFGPRIKVRTRGKALAEDSPAGAIVLLETGEEGNRVMGDFNYQRKDLYAFEDFYLVETNFHGGFSYGPEEKKKDPRTLQAFSVIFDDHGSARYVTTRDTFQKENEANRLFPAEGGYFALPPQLLPDSALVFNADGNSKLELKSNFYLTDDGFVYWYADEKVDRVKAFGEDSLMSLNVRDLSAGEEALARIGRGFPLVEPWSSPPAALQSASDLTRVDEARMQLLRSRGISNSSLEEVHGLSQDLLNEARATEETASREAKAASAYLRGKEVYAATVSSVRDLVNAVLILLILAVPFSFAMERLIIGATSIYRQVLGFAGFFAAGFLALYFTHPAFAISATPMVIFLGFTILLLSSLVIFIIMQKFEVELKAMQGMSSTVHTADVSRFSTILAAMSMGISTMRRRPMRTTLTAFTILLLTFTILSFASFGQQVGMVRLYNAPAPNYTGVFFHRINWKELDLPLLDLVHNRWRDSNAVVTERWWRTPETLEKGEPPINQGFVVMNDEQSDLVVLRGLLGLDYQEIVARPALRALLGDVSEDQFHRTLWLTEQSAARIGVEPGDTVYTGGYELVLGPYLKPRRMINTLDMDGSSILPVDLTSYDEEGQDDSAGSDESVQSSQSWSYLPVDSIAIGPAHAVREMGGSLRGISIYTPDSTTAGEVADDLATMVAMPVSATGRDGVYWHIFGSVLQASGARDLIFPIILGGLVIFGTMLGSVADRQKEIYTFSALGLAPTHVASLFFAEALVFSVIGGFGGYLLAQVIMKSLEFLATFGWVVVPEMNHSSTNAIITIVLVMITVILSSVYPAIKASRGANAGVMRNWRMPAPEGDRVELIFPFTVSEYDFTGVVSFLKEHFDNFQDTSLGVFMARDTQLIHVADRDEERERIGIRSTVALAPFDLGVTQEFTLTSAPSEIEGIDEVKIQIERRSGQPKDWQRLNKNLLNDLRKQFLIWRALPGDTMEQYRQRTLEALNEDTLPQQELAGVGSGSTNEVGAG